MKLRLRGNSIRLRLTQSEVRKFDREGRVEETVDFGPKKRRFVYALETTDDTDRVAAEFEEDTLRVIVPRAMAREWVNSTEVGIESGRAGNGGPIILIEKDFACLKERPGESDEDTFPNPNVGGCL